MKLVLGIAISALLLVSIIGFDDSWALKSQGIKQTITMSKNICGLDFCNVTQEIDEKISNYLGDLEKSSIEVIDYEDTNKSIAHITKTSIVSKDFLLVHYSDGNWELIDRYGFAKGVLKSQSQSGESQMEFGGTIDLSAGIQDSDVNNTVGMLQISQSEVLRPISNAIKDIRIYGNIGNKSFPNILLKIDYPDRPSQNFVLSVDDTGSFEAGLNIDKYTPLGLYQVVATYASASIGNVSFTISEQKIAGFGASDDGEKTSSITLSTDQITIPTSFSHVQTIQVSGTLVDYHRGNLVELILEFENGDESPRKITASKKGEFFTFITITPEFPEGVTHIILKYHGKEVARTSLSAFSPLFTLR